MLRVWPVFLLLSPAAFALVCPPIRYGSAIHKFTDGGDGSCYSEVDNGYTRSEIYTACGSYNSYLPVVTNAFQNTALQQKTKEGGIFGQNLPGIWLGLTCTGSVATSCSWSDGTPIQSTAYSNFAPGSPNATIGPCVYQDATTGLWLSDSCSSRKDVGFFCKFTPTNNVPMCSATNTSINPHPTGQYPDFFDGNCYSLYYSNNVEEAEGYCTATCGHIASIHSEGENSFVRDLLLKLWNTDYWSSRGYLGIKTGDTQWFDGTAVDYSHYGNLSSSSGLCSYMALDDSRVSPGFWFPDSCTQPLTRYVVCKKALLNACDNPFVPFPTAAPVLCAGPQYLNVSGTLYSPGNPYYPYGEQPNSCEYIQTLEAGLHPTITMTITNKDNFLPASNISSFEFYSSEEPTAAPFYTFDGSTGYYQLTSPTNVLRSVYSTRGDSRHANDWGEMIYSAKQRLSCSFVMDYSYLGYYNQSASTIYFSENNMVDDITFRLGFVYKNDKCQLDFAWNSAAYGNVPISASLPTPTNYTTGNPPLISSTGNLVDLCSVIDNLNSYTIPSGTETPCLVFFSGRSAQDFAACRPLNTKKFSYTFGVTINGQTGVSTFTSNVVNVTDFGNYNQEKTLMDMISQIIRPSSCK